MVLIQDQEEFIMKEVLNRKRVWGKLHDLIDWKTHMPQNLSEAPSTASQVLGHPGVSLGEG